MKFSVKIYKPFAGITAGVGYIEALNCIGCLTYSLTHCKVSCEAYAHNINAFNPLAPPGPLTHSPHPTTTTQAG